MDVPPKPPTIPFSNKTQARSLLSVLRRAHENEGGIMQFLDNESQMALRNVNRGSRETVQQYTKGYPLEVIRGSLEEWRRAYPRATVANISGRRDLRDADFVHLRGIRWVNMTGCKSITDAAFVHLRGIKVLNMSFCDQVTITDAAFVNLQGIERLNMSYCDQATITDAAFPNLRGIKVLNIARCHQRGITGSTLNTLGNELTRLQVFNCNQATIRNANAFYGVREGDEDVKIYPTEGGSKTRKSRKSRKSKKSRKSRST